MDLTDWQYSQLRRVAAALMWKESAAHTLSPTALLNETWLRLRGQRELDWGNPESLLIAARASAKRVLLDHARGAHAKRRNQRISLDDSSDLSVLDANQPRSPEHAAIRQALAKLGERDPELREIVRLHHMEGRTISEIAFSTRQSASSVKRRLKAAVELLRQYAE